MPFSSSGCWCWGSRWLWSSWDGHLIFSVDTKFLVVPCISNLRGDSPNRTSYPWVVLDEPFHTGGNCSGLYFIALAISDFKSSSFQRQMSWSALVKICQSARERTRAFKPKRLWTRARTQTQLPFVVRNAQNLRCLPVVPHAGATHGVSGGTQRDDTRTWIRGSNVNPTVLLAEDLVNSTFAAFCRCVRCLPKQAWN